MGTSELVRENLTNVFMNTVLTRLMTYQSKEQATSVRLVVAL